MIKNVEWTLLFDLIKILTLEYVKYSKMQKTMIVTVWNREKQKNQAMCLDFRVCVIYEYTIQLPSYCISAELSIIRL